VAWPGGVRTGVSSWGYTAPHPTPTKPKATAATTTDRDFVMKARTLAALVVSYNSTRGRYIVTVTKPVLQRASHGADDRRLAVWRCDVV
jgi:hypothetical protein